MLDRGAAKSLYIDLFPWSPTMKFIPACCAVLALAACGSSDICSHAATVQAALVSSSVVCAQSATQAGFNEATCKAGESVCTASDTAAVNDYLNCINSATGATCTISGLAACISKLSSVSAPCQAILINKGSGSGNGNNGSGTSTSGSTTGASSTSGGNNGSSSNGGTIGGSGTNGGTIGGSGSNGGSTGGTGSLHVGSPCTATAAGDPCVTSGLACTPMAANTSACELPSEYGFCEASVGCLPDGGFTLKCVQGFVGADGGTASLCIEPCTTPGVSTTCANAEDTCQNLVGDAGAPQDFCFQTACTAGSTGFYNQCNSAGTNDGQCLPFQGATGLVGICQQDGTAPLYATCAMERMGSAPLCADNGFCVNFTATASACLPLCDSTKSAGIAACTGGAQCQTLGSGLQWGVCVNPCGGDAGTTCPGSLTCKQGLCSP